MCPFLIERFMTILKRTKLSKNYSIDSSNTTLLDTLSLISTNLNCTSLLNCAVNTFYTKLIFKSCYRVNYHVFYNELVKKKNGTTLWPRKSSCFIYGCLRAPRVLNTHGQMCHISYVTWYIHRKHHRQCIFYRGTIIK